MAADSSRALKDDLRAICPNGVTIASYKENDNARYREREVFRADVEIKVANSPEPVIYSH